MFDTLTNQFIAINGASFDSFDSVKASDAKALGWYNDRANDATFADHLTNCHTCTMVDAMYADAFAGQRQFTSLGRVAEWETELLNSVDTDQVARQDADAALRQAEILGASADQRRKLRTIVEERLAAQKEAAELRERVTELEGLHANQFRTIQEQTAMLAAPITDPADRRLWGIFGRAADEANDQGYCSVYDQISREVGIPDREELEEAGYLEGKPFDVTTEVTFQVTITVNAANSDAAISEVDDMDDDTLWEYIDNAGLDRSSITSHDARDAERVEE